MSALSALLAVVAHLAGGGTLVPTYGLALAVIALAGVSTWFASEVGRRTRGLLSTAMVLAAGQAGLELVLWAGDRSVHSPVLAAGLHALADVLLLILVLGAERVSADLRATADRAAPPLRWLLEPAPVPDHGPRLVPRTADAAVIASRWCPRLRPVRGPPLLLT